MQTSVERNTIPSSLPLSRVQTNVFLKLTTKQSFMAKPTQEIHGPRLSKKIRASKTPQTPRICSGNENKKKTQAYDTRQKRKN